MIAKKPPTPEVKDSDEEKVAVVKPRFDEATASSDPHKGRGGAYRIDENGHRVPDTE
jgi:hypothetical protein